MKVKATYKDDIINFSSYAAFYRWAKDNNLFVSKSNKTGLNQNCSKVIFTQKDDSKLIGQYFYPDTPIFEYQWKRDVEFYLEEVPDREDEMRDMLEELIKTLQQYEQAFGYDESKVIDKAKQLLNK